VIGALLVGSLLAWAAQAPTFEQLSTQAQNARKIDRNDLAVPLYQQALALEPSWAEGWWDLGSALYEKGRYAEARDAFRKLVAIDKKAVAGYALLGICEYKTAEFDASLKDLDVARTLGMPNGHPISTAARYYLAVLLNSNGLHDAAGELLLSLSEAADKAPTVLDALGMAGLRLAKRPEQLSETEAALARKLGEALAAAGQRRVDESLALLENLLKQNPTQPNLHFVYGQVLLGSDADQAVEAFRKELELQPGSVATLLALAREMERTERLEQARSFAQKAVAAAPADFAGHALLGRILVSMGQPQEGVRELERARDIEPGSPQVFYSLASAYAKLGRHADAEKARAEFLRLKKLADGEQ